MGSLSDHSRLNKLVLLLLLFQVIVYLLLAIPFRFILDNLYPPGEYFPSTGSLCIVHVFAMIFLWYRPRTRVFVGLTIFADILMSIIIFYDNTSWVISDLRILLFLMFFVPIIPFLYFVMTLEIIEKSEIRKDFRFDTYVVKIQTHDNLIEGLDIVLASLSDGPSVDVPQSQDLEFLEYVSQREDELGKIAREKLEGYL